MYSFVTFEALPGLDLTPGNRQIYLLPVDLNVPDAELDGLRQFLTPDEQARSQDYYFERDRRRYIAGRAGLRRALASVLAIKPRMVEFCYGTYGKPALANRETPRLHFNFSHSGDWALLALSAERPLGVDIEQVRPVPDMLTLAERFFSPSETSALQACADSDRAALFFRFWTCKEAFLKATGAGLQQPLTSLTLELADDHAAGFLTDAKAERLPYTLAILTLAAGYPGALVVPSD